MPSKRVIILERTNPAQFRFVLWADVPVARQPFMADPARVSAWDGASQAENDALASGAVLELVDTVNATGLAAAQTLLESRWQAFQDNVTSDNRWVRYGSYWDGAAWVQGGVA